MVCAKDVGVFVQVQLNTEPPATRPTSGTIWGATTAFRSVQALPRSPTRAERGKARAEGSGKSTTEEDTGCAQPEAAIRFQNIFGRPKTPKAPPSYKNSKKRKDEGGQSSGVSNKDKGKDKALTAPPASVNSTTEAEHLHAKVYKTLKRTNTSERAERVSGYMR